jgi:hypothetical protein
MRASATAVTSGAPQASAASGPAVANGSNSPSEIPMRHGAAEATSVPPSFPSPNANRIASSSSSSANSNATLRDPKAHTLPPKASAFLHRSATRLMCASPAPVVAEPTRVRKPTTIRVAIATSFTMSACA